MNAALNTLSAPARNAGHPHWSEGLQLADAADWRGAARAFGRATRAAPHDTVYWLNLAHAQRRAGALDRALAAVRRCLQFDATEPVALRLLGDTLLQLHRYVDAVRAFERLEATGAEETDALVQHAHALQALHRPGEAAALLLRALSLKPELVRGHALLSDCCRDQGLWREAVECMKTVLALEPDNLEAMSRLSFESRHLMLWDDFDMQLQALRGRLATLGPRSAGIVASFALLSLPLEPELQLAAAQCESRYIAGQVRALPPVDATARTAQRIRLGWLSYDFRDHAVSQLLVEVLEGIDRRRFEVVLYSAGHDDGSPLRARLQATADRFVELRGLSDKQAAERVRADGIDLLVDLMGHTRGHRMGIFAQRPAPVQVGYLGYPGSTGSEFIDYIIGDPLVTPLALAHHYSEKIAQLPLTFQPNGRVRPLPQPMTRAEAGLPEDAFVMCAFNHTYKILPQSFDTWCVLLRELPNAVLWLKETNKQLRENVLAHAAERGVAPERIVFAQNLRYDQHFSRLALADVFVDTWPYNAHTTASDALWAGVPVVTVYGNGFASRVAASVLNAAGIGELAFATVEDYQSAVMALALDPALRAGYRQHLVSNRDTSALFDTARYTGELQDLLQRMVERSRAGLPAEHLSA